MSRKIMIVTGEASGDLHGGNLVKSLQSKEPELQFCGMGGPELAACGVEILYDAAKVSVVGFFEVCQLFQFECFSRYSGFRY